MHLASMDLACWSGTWSLLARIVLLRAGKRSRAVRPPLRLRINNTTLCTAVAGASGVRQAHKAPAHAIAAVLRALVAPRLVDMLRKLQRALECLQSCGSNVCVCNSSSSS